MEELGLVVNRNAEVKERSSSYLSFHDCSNNLHEGLVRSCSREESQKFGLIYE